MLKKYWYGIVGCLFSLHLAAATNAIEQIQSINYLDEHRKLQNYVVVNCIASVYENIKPQPKKLIEMMRSEGWAIVEKTNMGPNVYKALYQLAQDKAKNIYPEAALLNCMALKDNIALKEQIMAIMLTEKGGDV